MTRNHYEEKQERRRERLEEAADRAEREGHAKINRGRDMASVIPFGQPILVGHHSEKRDRNYRRRIDNTMRAGHESLERAGDLRARAAAVGTGGISSDDPDAPDKLRERLEELEKKQAHMKEVNKALRKGDDAALAAMGLSAEAVAKLKEPDFAGRTGYPDYALTNNGANLRRLRKRLARLERHADDETTSETVGKVEIRDNAEINRVQIIFPGKPDEGVRRQLKASGFRWARSEGAWQRHRSAGTLHQARAIVAGLPQ